MIYSIRNLDAHYKFFQERHDNMLKNKLLKIAWNVQILNQRYHTNTFAQVAYWYYILYISC